MAIPDWRYGTFYFALSLSYPYIRPNQTLYQRFWRRTDGGKCRCSHRKGLQNNRCTNRQLHGSTGLPDTHQKGGHEWIIEFTTPPASLEQFTHILDEALRELNSDYDAKRSHDLALVTPKIHSVKPGTFYNWLKSKGKLGGQNKVPRLSNTREYVDDLLQMIGQD